MTRRRAKRRTRRRVKVDPLVVEIEGMLERARGRTVMDYFIDRFFDHVLEQFPGMQLPGSPRPPWCDVLGVSPLCSVDEIEAAYRRLAMQHHPDRGGDGARMAAINAARDAALQQRRESYA